MRVHERETEDVGVVWDESVDERWEQTQGLIKAQLPQRSFWGMFPLLCPQKPLSALPKSIQRFQVCAHHIGFKIFKDANCAAASDPNNKAR